MRTFSRNTIAVALILTSGTMLPGPSAHAQDNTSFYNNRSVQYGLNLPHIPTPSGQDEIRAADGTTCRSSTSNNGAYLDVGSIGNQSASGGLESASFYGRMVIPLGEKPQRLNCRGLYQLEIERLRSELELVKAGLGGGGNGRLQPTSAGSASSNSANWQTTGWSNGGQTAPAQRAGRVVRWAHRSNKHPWFGHVQRCPHSDLRHAIDAIFGTASGASASDKI